MKLITKGTIIGLISGIVLFIINLIIGLTPNSTIQMFTPDYFGLISCGKICWSYWIQITFLEIIVSTTIIGLLIGLIISKSKGKKK